MQHKLRISGSVLALFCLFANVEPAQAQPRIALVIGNADYQRIAALDNPVNDAVDIAAKLRKLGFAVTVHTDADQAAMEAAVERFGTALRGAEVALFYYAGHGVQKDGQNYLIPLRGKIRKALDLKYRAVNASWVLDHMDRAPTALKIMVLDACRNNPFRGWGRGAEDKGLAGMAGRGGTLLAYAAQPGGEAEDGDGRNGTYTAELLERLDRPGITIQEMFNEVGWAVNRKTDGRQDPWLSSSALPRFCLAGSCERPRRDEALATERVLWESIEHSPAEALYRLYLERYPRGRYAAIARERLASTIPEQAGTSVPASSPGVTKVPSSPLEYIEPEMVLISGGCFQMGSPSSEKGQGGDEGPVHQVCVKDFRMGKYEVTFAEYDRFAEATGREKPNDRGWGRGRQPVINVSWHDAVAYAVWLSRETGRGFRLPTEAEWEYAARAGSRTWYWRGDEVGRNRANCIGCGSQWDGKQTAPVGSFAANGFGLHDTAGNVWEWTCSASTETYDGKETRCVSDNRARVLRGGSWGTTPRWLRSVYRGRLRPSSRADYIGFRLATN